MANIKILEAITVSAEKKIILKMESDQKLSDIQMRGTYFFSYILFFTDGGIFLYKKYKKIFDSSWQLCIVV